MKPAFVYKETNFVRETQGEGALGAEKTTWSRGDFQGQSYSTLTREKIMNGYQYGFHDSCYTLQGNQHSLRKLLGRSNGLCGDRALLPLETSSSPVNLISVHMPTARLEILLIQ